MASAAQQACATQPMVLLEPMVGCLFVASCSFRCSGLEVCFETNWNQGNLECQLGEKFDIQAQAINNPTGELEQTRTSRILVVKAPSKGGPSSY